MKLSLVLENTALPENLAQTEVLNLAYDSRLVTPGTLFFAFPGVKTDGRKYAVEAIEKGAIAIVCDSPRPDTFDGPWIHVRHGRQSLALAARNFFGKPDRELNLTGITGTNGKTTTAYLTDSIFRTAGKMTSLIGTIEYHVAGEIRPAVNTTPESLDLLKIFQETGQRGGSHVTMEVSSHALALGRVYGLQFHTAVFTNLTRDHLDFHQTMESYFEAKQLLFQGAGAPPPKFAVVNADDSRSRKIAFTGETISYGIGPAAALRASAISSSFDGLRFQVEYEGARYPVESPMVGNFNVSNILAAYGVGLSCGFGHDAIARGIAACLNVPGRFERVEEGQPFLVVVDYAHTDDALKNVIAVARNLKPRRVITLFGCGGDRDRAKRPLMGMAAASGSDFVVLTSDNPRSEDPLAIMNDAMVGLRRLDTPHVVEPDREKAIQRAIREAGPQDIVLLAGKGHETYQVLKDKTIHFDDREVARNLLRSFGYGKQ
jgi:UDP-N-acetylmuramoyl-L-alanyl-D-glutamate--2,6-diaminopimelate ligase